MAVGIVLVSKYLNSKTKTAWPSVDTLSNKTNYDRRTVQRSLKQLTDCGHFILVEKGGGSGQGIRTNTNVYKAILKVAPTPPLKHGDKELTAAPADVKGGNEDRLKAATLPPEPIIEPDINLQKNLKKKKWIDGSRGVPLKNDKRSKAFDWSNLENRQAFARQRIAEKLGLQNEGWQTVIAAEDPDHPQHKEARELCIKTAKAAKVRWMPP
jgi:hypothetical protein